MDLDDRSRKVGVNRLSYLTDLLSEKQGVTKSRVIPSWSQKLESSFSVGLLKSKVTFGVVFKDLLN